MNSDAHVSISLTELCVLISSLNQIKKSSLSMAQFALLTVENVCGTDQQVQCYTSTSNLL